MATTTTNFGWDIPQSTDLVKDGATAIAALGQDIDTALIDLKGGTTGQVLSKASNTDLDYTWVTDPGGDITGVTAGTGISGGGTSGTVTVTNSMATAIDAKGDLIAGTGADAFDRLAIGANDTVLTADSTAATGMKWAAASAGGTYTAYTPTFTNFTIGNGTINYARYTQIGKFVQAYGKVTLGSTSSMGTNPNMTLPVTANANTTGGWVLGSLTIGDTGTATYEGYVKASSTTVAQMVVGNVSGTYTTNTAIQATLPMTWASTDTFLWSFIYEAA